MEDESVIRVFSPEELEPGMSPRELNEMTQWEFDYTKQHLTI